MRNGNPETETLGGSLAAYVHGIYGIALKRYQMKLKKSQCELSSDLAPLVRSPNIIYCLHARLPHMYDSNLCINFNNGVCLYTRVCCKKTNNIKGL
jgi:hypothetical protein